MLIPSEAVNKEAKLIWTPQECSPSVSFSLFSHSSFSCCFPPLALSLSPSPHLHLSLHGLLKLENLHLLGRRSEPDQLISTQLKGSARLSRAFLRHRLEFAAIFPPSVDGLPGGAGPLMLFAWQDLSSVPCSKTSRWHLIEELYRWM